MRLRTLFFLASSIPCLAAFADLEIGKSYALKFVDVDGNTLSTGDGRVTVLVVTTKADLAKAQRVGDRVPDHCLGDPDYRMITLVKFGKRSAPMRVIITAMTRRRLDSEAKRVQPRYAAGKIEKDPRADIFAVADFDGTAAAELGGQSTVFTFSFLAGTVGYSNNGTTCRRRPIWLRF